MPQVFLQQVESCLGTLYSLSHVIEIGAYRNGSTYRSSSATNARLFFSQWQLRADRPSQNRHTLVVARIASPHAQTLHSLVPPISCIALSRPFLDRSTSRCGRTITLYNKVFSMELTESNTWKGSNVLGVKVNVKVRSNRLSVYDCLLILMFCTYLVVIMNLIYFNYKIYSVGLGNFWKYSQLPTY